MGALCAKKGNGRWRNEFDIHFQTLSGVSVFSLSKQKHTQRAFVAFI